VTDFPGQSNAPHFPPVPAWNSFAAPQVSAARRPRLIGFGLTIRTSTRYSPRRHSENLIPKAGIGLTYAQGDLRPVGPPGPDGVNPPVAPRSFRWERSIRRGDPPGCYGRTEMSFCRTTGILNLILGKAERERSG